jgi:mono/diheme cytochrome c family protein
MNAISQFSFLTLTLIISFVSNAAQSPDSGAQLWRKNCASCHGADGRGAPAIKAQLQGEITDFTSLAFAETSTRKGMLLTVRDGKKDTLMPSFRESLNYTQILAVVDYARENFILANVEGENYQLGKTVFAKNCRVCHGDSGQSAVWTAGGLLPKPADFTDPAKIALLTKSRMLFSVTNGRPETAMVSWKNRLSTEEIAGVVNYIRAAFMKVDDRVVEFGDAMGAAQNKADPFLSGESFAESDITQVNSKAINKKENSAATNDPFLQSRAYQEIDDLSLKQDDIFAGESHDHEAHMGKKLNIKDPLPNDLVGNYFAGKDLYENTCASCHGIEGNGKGPRAYFIFPKPRNFTHSAAQASFSRAHIFERIRTGVPRTEMPAWGTVLSEQQMANVAEYVFSTFISAQASQAVQAKEASK